METNYIFKNMDIERSAESGLLIAKTKICLPGEDIVQSPTIVFSTKCTSWEAKNQTNTSIYIPDNNIIYGGLKSELCNISRYRDEH